MADQHIVESTDKANLRRRSAAPDSRPGGEGADAVHPLLRLQSQVGNANIARLLAQRAEEDELATKHDLAQRAEEDELAAKHDETVGVEGGPVGPDTQARIQAMRGGGSPLEESTRTRMEAGFGTSFRDVRVHSDSTADMLNRRLTARAFTTGSDIFLRQDSSATDSQLMGHELSHVVQQRSMSGGGGGMRVGAAGDDHERHADSVADALTTATQSQAPAAQAQRVAEEDEMAAKHDLTQRAEEDELAAKHDLAQRAEEDELAPTHDLSQRAEEDELAAKHDLAQRAEEEELAPKHDLTQREAAHDDLSA
jgi:hypothetical protein